MGLDFRQPGEDCKIVWTQPYLETCCRAALHRLYLAGSAGRPADQMDCPCLERLAAMGHCVRSGQRFKLTSDGTQRHATEVLKRDGVTTAVR